MNAPSSGSQPKKMLFFLRPFRPQPSELDDEEEEEEPVEADEAAEDVPDVCEDQSTEEPEPELPELGLALYWYELSVEEGAACEDVAEDQLDEDPEAWILDAILMWCRRWQPASTETAAPARARATRAETCIARESCWVKRGASARRIEERDASG